MALQTKDAVFCLDKYRRLQMQGHTDIKIDIQENSQFLLARWGAEMPPSLLYKYTVIIFNKSIDKVSKITDNNIMLNRKGDNMNIFEKKKLILTEWDSSPESKRNFKKAIKKLKAENIPFIIVEKRLVSEIGKKLYISYSVVMDSILLITVILALLNADKILKLLG